MSVDYNQRQDKAISNYNHQHDTSSSSFSAQIVESFSKVFGFPVGRVVAFKKITFITNKRKFVSMIGPSGSGKLTLSNILEAIYRLTFGKVFLGMTDFFSSKDHEIASIIK